MQERAHTETDRDRYTDTDTDSDKDRDTDTGTETCREACRNKEGEGVQIITMIIQSACARAYTLLGPAVWPRADTRAGLAAYGSQPGADCNHGIAVVIIGNRI